MATVHDNITEWPDRYDHLKGILSTKTPLCMDFFEPGDANIEALRNTRVLVVGAGGLGCEILKVLAMSGFRSIEVIDKDTIDLSNLNRQFLFRLNDIGKPKARIAAEKIENRVPGCKVKWHFCGIEDREDNADYPNFYGSFDILIAGLDNVEARCRLNRIVCEMRERKILPLIDGGTEALNGSVRVIIPGMTSCMDCYDLFTKRIVFQQCTIANTPRIPEHCIAWAKEMHWPDVRPNDNLDTDDADHIQWLFEKASDYAKQHNIAGVTHMLTKGVAKNIIPAVASTNAVIGAFCATEAFKLATGYTNNIYNYMKFHAGEGVYAASVNLEKSADCLTCNRVSTALEVKTINTLRQLVDQLSIEYQLKCPTITASGSLLYAKFDTGLMSNLDKQIKDLELENKFEMIVEDAALGQPKFFDVTLVD